MKSIEFNFSNAEITEPSPVQEIKSTPTPDESVQEFICRLISEGSTIVIGGESIINGCASIVVGIIQCKNPETKDVALFGWKLVSHHYGRKQLQSFNMRHGSRLDDIPFPNYQTHFIGQCNPILANENADPDALTRVVSYVLREIMSAAAGQRLS